MVGCKDYIADNQKSAETGRHFAGGTCHDAGIRLAKSDNALINLLFSSAGRRVELIQCFRNAAFELNCEIHIVAIDADPGWSPACQVADSAFKVPRCDDRHFISTVADICQHHRVQLVIPTIDTELSIYANNRDIISASGAEILLSDKDVVAIARDKKKTAEKLQTHGIRTPKTWPARCLELGDVDIPFPLIMKPVDGSCSNGIFKVGSQAEVLSSSVDLDRYVAQEICRGEEYTTNAFYTLQGQCAACVPHYRKFVRDGEVCFAETVRVPEFSAIAHRLSEIFSGLRGNICFQGFLDESGQATVFEINARFGGGYPICDQAGGTYAKWILQELMGQVPDYHDRWQEGLRMLRYDAAVFFRP